MQNGASHSAKRPLSLRKVEITLQEDHPPRYIARLVFMSRTKSDERLVGPFDDFEELLSWIRQIKFGVEALGKKAGDVSR